MDDLEHRQRQAVVAEAHTWLRTPFHHAARMKGIGVDCAQLLVGVYAAAGMIDEFEPEYYPADWHLHRDTERFLAQIIAMGGIETTDPLAGDVAVWRFGRCYSHGGIIINDAHVIHSHINQCCMISERNQPPFSDKHALYFTLWGPA